MKLVLVFLSAALVALSSAVLFSPGASAQKAAKPETACYSPEARAAAIRTAHVYRQPDASYDPVLGYGSEGPRIGSPPVDENGRAKPIACVAADRPTRISGTLPKFYCTVPGVVDAKGKPVRYKIKPHFKGQSKDKRNAEIYGEFLSSRFSKALGFFADDEWVADVTCPDCEKSLSKDFQGAKFEPFQPAAGVEMSLGNDLDANCDGNSGGEPGESLSRLSQGDARAEVDAFKLWLAFIDHGDTKKDNQRFACLESEAGPNGRVCKPGMAIFYIGDMGSTFGFSTASERKARLELWKGKDPITVSGGRCSTTAKGVSDRSVGEAGRQLLANGLQRLLDAEASDHLITRVFDASRNAERDQPSGAWTAEFVRKAKTIIDARCGR